MIIWELNLIFKTAAKIACITTQFLTIYNEKKNAVHGIRFDHRKLIKRYENFCVHLFLIPC